MINLKGSCYGIVFESITNTFNAIGAGLDAATTAANNAISTYVLIGLLILGGLYFTFRTKFVQFRLLKAQFQAVTEKPKDK